MLVEVCANSLQSAINAELAGADRIELCSELAVGGITPSYGLLKLVREKVNIPINVLIRPRSGDFTYSDDEFQIMKSNVKLCKDLGFNGIVSGILLDDFTIDLKRTEELRILAEGLHFTFHRAFDWLSVPEKSLGELESIGVDTILTSGQASSATEGLSLLKSLHEKTENCTIMPGGGVKPTNIAEFKTSGFKAVHLSGTQFIQTLNAAPKVSMNSPSFLKDNQLAISNVDTIQKVVKAVK